MEWMTEENGLTIIFVVGMMAVLEAIESKLTESKKSEPLSFAVMLGVTCLILTINKFVWMMGEDGPAIIFVVGMMAVLTAAEAKLTTSKKSELSPDDPMLVDGNQPNSLAEGGLFDKCQKVLAKGNCLILLALQGRIRTI